MRGVVIMARENDSLFKKYDNILLPIQNEKHFEYTVVSNGREVIVCIYRAPDGNIINFFNNLNILLEAISKNHHIILCGDFNINFLENKGLDTTALEFKSILYCHKLTPAVNTPTRISASTSTLIDNIFVNCASLLANTHNLQTGYSDHTCQIIQLKDDSQYEPQDRITEIKRSFTKKNKNVFTKLLQDQDWGPVLILNNVDEKLDIFYTILTNHFNQAFPKKRTRITENGEFSGNWITPGIRVSCRKRRELIIIKRINPNFHIINYVKKYISILKKTIKLAKKLHIKRNISNASDKIKETWKVINSELKNKTGQRNNNITLKLDENKIISEAPEIAEEFNKAFISVVSNINSNANSGIKHLQFALKYLNESIT